MVLSTTRMVFHSFPILLKGWELNQHVTSKELEERASLNERSLSVILTRLVRTGILRSVTGGKIRGYMFSRDPRTIYLGEIVETLEGVRSFNSCREILGSVKCVIKCDECMIYGAINGAYNDVYNKLKLISVYDYVKYNMTEK